VDGYRCECGFDGGSAGELADHLLEMFCPQDGIAPDGTAHDEGPVKLACLCGFNAATATGLDEHFLAAFTPGDCIGADGGKHVPVDHFG
jgi:hypothetical protein